MAQQAWEDVEKLLSQMRPLLLEAKIPERQTKMPEGRPPDQIPVEQYVKAFDWLHKLSQTAEYLELKRVYGLLKPATWQAYRANAITGLREQLLLEAASIALRKAWKLNRPSFFGRVYRGKQDEVAVEHAGDSEATTS